MEREFHEKPYHSYLVKCSLERNSLTLEQIDLIEIHEAFAAQVLANAKAWEQGWKAQPIGAVDWQRVNVSGSSVAMAGAFLLERN